MKFIKLEMTRRPATAAPSIGDIQTQQTRLIFRTKSNNLPRVDSLAGICIPCTHIIIRSCRYFIDMLIAILISLNIFLSISQQGDSLASSGFASSTTSNNSFSPSPSPSRSSSSRPLVTDKSWTTYAHAENV